MGREDLIGDTRYSAAAGGSSGAPRSTRVWPTGRVKFDKHTVMRLVAATAPGRGDPRYARDRRRPSFEQRKIRQTMAHPASNNTMRGWPVRFGDAPPPVAPVPLLGQQSGNVLADWLKMDDIAIGTLRDAKVIAGDLAATAVAAE
jgi:hypothetical protein